MNSKINSLTTLIECTKLLRLNEQDIKNANEFLKYNEFGLCFDTLVTQIYENDIEITDYVYTLICKIGNELQLPFDSYSYTKELVRNKGNIPKTVKDKLSNIIKLFLE